MHMAGFTHQECADKLGQSEKLVRSRAAKARKNLRARKPDVGKYAEFLMAYRPRCKRENYFKRARQGETDRYIRQGKRTYAGYSLPTLL
jgi:hypothetical protein